MRNELRYYEQTISRQPLCDLVPVHYVPPRRDIVGSLVLVLEVIGVLPDIETEERGLAFHERAVLVGRRVNAQLTCTIFDEPRPAASKPLHAGIAELFLKLREAAEL